MAFRSEKIGIVVTQQLNRNVFLPDIQREFVWKPEKIIKLFDSIMRKYPISSFLFWKVGDDLKNQVDCYAFFQDFKEEQVHINPINTNGASDLTLVLDGQQRLTSVLIGLKGSYKMRKKWKRRKSADAWEKKQLYINLLRNPELPDLDSDFGLRYEFEFFEDTPPVSDSAYWLPVSTILNYSEFASFSKFKYAERKKLSTDTDDYVDKLEIFETNLDRLYHAVWTDDAIPYHVENEQDSDRVLDIFVRTNDGGVQLSKSDLLLSMITANWGNVNAKAGIQGLVEHINSDLPRKNDFNKDFVLKACLALCDFNVRYKVENFNRNNLSVIQSNWSDIGEAIKSGIKLINSFGIDRDTLTSANAVIPIIYYLYKSGKFKNIDLLIDGNSASDATIRQSIRRWLILALLGRVFGGHSDEILTRARTAINAHLQAPNADFPIKEINRAVDLQFDVEDFLDISYNDRTCFLALSLLYDKDDWGLVTYQKDHIFAKSGFNVKGFESASVPSDKRQEYWSYANSIANLQLLVSQENAGKSDKDYESWFSSRDSSYRDKHLIPQDNSLFSFSKFLDFIEEREKLITDRLRAIGIIQ